MISISDAKQAKRLETLTIWFRRATADGHPVPTDAELAGIAANPNGWNDPPVSDVVDAWAPTIAHLLHQVKFGVDPDVAADITGELCTPARPIAVPTPSTPEPATTADDRPSAANSVDRSDPDSPQLLDRLLQWRSRRIADGAEGADTIKDVTLANLVKFNHTDAEQIRKKLPGPAAYLAAEIAAVMGGSTSTDSPEPVVRSMSPIPAPAPPPAPATAPATTPPVTPATPSPPRQAGTASVFLDLDHNAFSPYEYGDSDVEVAQIAVKTTADGIRLTFDPYVPETDKMVIYRVVSGENVVPYKPEAGDIVAVTTGLAVEDERFATSAVRTYQVWCHVGLDREDACRSQPFLLAQAEAVSPVDDFTLTEDEGRVIGQWSVFPGTRAVRVYRIPLNSAAPPATDDRYRICAEEPNLTGFVDIGAERGERYLYRALAEVPVGESTRLSKPTQQEVLVSVVLQPVTDLTVNVAGDDDTQFDLVWSAPTAGTVKVYRLAGPPPAGLGDTDMDEAQLQPQGLNEDSRIKHPVTSADLEHSQMRGVPWPADWQRAYLVPVTVLNGRARVGTTTITTRALPPVTDMEIIERFHTEVVTFGWPPGAASVKAFVGLDSMSPEEICANNQPTEEINEARYRRDGGLAFAKRLASNGCLVCLVPVAYSRGEEVRGRIATQRYPGLARVEYKLVYVPGTHTVQLWLKADTEVEYPPPMMLINNLDRFPLSSDDGQFVPLTPPDRSQQLPQCTVEHISRDGTDSGWTIDLSPVQGFFRLFFGPQPPGSRPLALKDPGLEDLYRYPQQGAAQ